MSRATGRAVYLSWMAHNGRSAGMADGLGADPVYIYGGKDLGLARRYLKQWRMTGRMLRAKRPGTVLVMQPPVLSLLRVWLYSLRSGTKIAADMHTGAFEDPRWKWANGLILRIARSKNNRAVVTNEHLAKRTRSRGVTTFVCHGKLRPFHGDPTDFDDTALGSRLEGDFVLVPLAWAYDEPIAAVLAAARARPEITWVLTGKPKPGAAPNTPDNVVLTGFVSQGDYDRLRSRAAVVAALTTAEYTMQRSGYEALEAGTPLVTSPMMVLEEYFGDAAVYTGPDGSAIAAAVDVAIAEAPQRRAAMQSLLHDKLTEQESALAAIRRWIES